MNTTTITIIVRTVPVSSSPLSEMQRWWLPEQQPRKQKQKNDSNYICKTEKPVYGIGQVFLKKDFAYTESAGVILLKKNLLQ